MTGSRNSYWLFIESELSGHHATYLEHIVAAAHEWGVRPIVALGSGSNAHSLAARWRIQMPDAEFVHFPFLEYPQRSVPDLLWIVRKELAYWRHFREVYSAVSKVQPIERVFIPYLDYCLYACGLRGTPFGNTPFDGLCMRPGFHHAEMGVVVPKQRSATVKEYLFRRALRIKTLQRLFVNDETLFLYAQHRASSVWSKVRRFPDPVQFSGSCSRENARKILGIDGDVPVVLVYGFLDWQKGVDCLLEGMRQPDAPADLVLLLAGECSEGVRSLLETNFATNLRRQGRLIILDRRVTDSEEQMCFAAADITWLGYIEKYCMSGVLVKAIQSKHWIISAKAGLIYWYAARLEQIVAVNVEVPNEVSGALSRCLALMNVTGQPRGANLFSQNNWRHCAELIFGSVVSK